LVRGRRPEIDDERLSDFLDAIRGRWAGTAHSGLEPVRREPQA